MIFESVQAEVEKMPEPLRSSGLAASALALASRVAEAPDRDIANIARELRMTLAELRAMAKQAPGEVDPLDELERRRRDKVGPAPVSKRAAGGKVARSGGRGPSRKRGSDS